MLRPALLGFVAMCAIAIGASLPSSPFKLRCRVCGSSGYPTDVASTWAVYFTLAAVYGGLLLLMRVWGVLPRLYSDARGCRSSG